jgi:hypothetical protein
MKVLNLFFIGIILYLCYKIFTMSEQFQTLPSTKIDLSGKNLIFGKNLGINMDETKLEELNKLDIDLSKNNLLIDNKYDNKVSIKKELCIGNFCINKDKLKLIAGKIDAPQFYKTDENGITDKPVYYNHDCNINNKTNKYCNIETVTDLPNKICFNYETKVDSKNKPNKLCIGAKEFDILKGKRGIKLKHNESNLDIDTSVDVTDKSTIMSHEDLENSYSYNKYLMPYYADFRATGMDIESTKDQLLFKNNHQCTNTSTLYKLNHNFNPRKYPYYKDAKSEINCGNVDCNDPLQSRLCLHKCAATIIDRENKNNKNNKLFNIDTTIPESNEVNIENDPKIIDKDGWIIDDGWERKCVLDSELDNSSNKKLYCMKYKSNPLKSDIDLDEKTGKTKKDRRRTGSRTYKCDSKPNWAIVEGVEGVSLKDNFISKNGNIKYMFPDAIMYGIDAVLAKHSNASQDDILKLKENINKYNQTLSSAGQRSNSIVFEQSKRGWTGLCCGEEERSGKTDVNSCINDYNMVNNLKNEFDIENNHGWYKLPESEPIDPNYNGYYIDKYNNNTKYIINDNAVAKASKFLGNIDNHRVSHDGVCGKSNKDISNMHYFCNSPNSNNPLYNKVCNPITYQQSKIQQCMNEKRDVDIINTLTSEPTTSIALTEEEQLQYNDDLETCVQQNSGDSIIEINPSTTSVNSETYNKNIIDSRFTELNELDELNYFIQPSKDTSGNIIKSNTYFHAHNHKHSNI